MGRVFLLNVGRVVLEQVLCGANYLEASRPAPPRNCVSVLYRSHVRHDTINIRLFNVTVYMCHASRSWDKSSRYRCRGVISVYLHGIYIYTAVPRKTASSLLASVSIINGLIKALTALEHWWVDCH